jgi:hypothetical protein
MSPTFREVALLFLKLGTIGREIRACNDEITRESVPEIMEAKIRDSCPLER